MREVPSFLGLAAVLLVTLSSVISPAEIIAQRPAQTIPSQGRRLAVQPSASEPRVALAGSVSDRPATSANLGHLSAALRINGMSIIIKRTPAQEAALDQLLRDQQNPQSLYYHHWLTPQAFGDRFGLAPGDLEILTTWLRAQGFEVAEVAPSRNRIVFSGTAAQAEAAFSVTLIRYRSDEQTFFENREPVRLPQSLSAVVSGITGLSSYRLHGHALLRNLSIFAPQYTSSAGLVALVPWDFRQIYDINPLINSGDDGTGVKIGVIGQSAFSSTQVSDFQLKTGQPTKLPTTVLVPNTGVSNLVEGDEDESELDLEYSGGTAPGASVQFIYTGCGTAASSTALPGTTDCQNDGVNTSLIYAITNNLAPILTFSYGACEAEIASYASSTLEPILKQANAQGQTILVSSGDSGAATCDQGTNARGATQGLSVSYPASSAYVTAVGGTQLSSSGFSPPNNSYGGSAIAYSSEQAWNDTGSFGTLAATGGGVSKIFPKPAWQVGTYVPQDGFRDVPDVAFAASVLNVPYFACTADASCQANATIGGTSTAPNGGLYGGTSLSAPNFAAMLAVIEQKNSSGPLGNINPLLYALGQDASGSSVFHDVTFGDNRVPCVLGTPDCGESNTFKQIGYGAGGGYDQVTGLGSISATGLAAALAADTPAVSLAVSPNPPIVDQPVTFRATVLGVDTAPTGNVTFSIDGTAVGSPVPLSSGTAKFSYSGFTAPFGSSSGNYALTASYSGDSSHAASNVTLNLTAAQIPVNLTISSSVSQLQTNAATTFTFTGTGAYGTPVGYVLLLIDDNFLASAASPIPMVNGVATYTYEGFSSAGLHTITAKYWSEQDKQEGVVHTAPYVLPFASYEGGQTVLDLQVSAPTQTLIPIVTLTSSTTGVVAPSDSVQYSLAVKGTGSVAPTGGYTLTVDGDSSQQQFGPATSGGLTASLTLGNVNWTPGTHTVQVTYNGDDNYKPAAQVSATFNVVLPGFTLAASPSTLAIATGASGSTTLTVNAGPTYSGSTTFQLGLLSYTGVPFSGCYGLSSTAAQSQRGTPASVTLTVYSGTSHCTASNHMGTLSAAAVPPHRNFLPVSAASLCIVGCFAFRRRKLSSTLLVAFISATLISGVGCGGGGASSGGNGGGGGGTGPTPPSVVGSYVLQVTGISGSDSTVAAKTTFTLTVQ